MRGIYPDYVGPTDEYRMASLYPHWTWPFDGTLTYSDLVGYELVPTPEGYTVRLSMFSGALRVELGYTHSPATIAGIPIPSKLGYSLGEEPGVD